MVRYCSWWLSGVVLGKSSTRCSLCCLCASGWTGEWVEEFRLDVSLDGEDWSPVCARPKHPLKFTGNTDASVTVKNRLPVPVTARYIRVVPLTWHTRPALRVELFTLGACCTDCSGCTDCIPPRVRRTHTGVCL